MNHQNVIQKKIYYHDTDSGGVVYYANYLNFLEEGRHEYLLDRGADLKALAASGLCFVVARVELDYKSPARYQDRIEVRTAINKIGRCSLEFRQQVTKNNLCLVNAQVTTVCVGADFKPKSLPEELRRKLF